MKALLLILLVCLACVTQARRITVKEDVSLKNAVQNAIAGDTIMVSAGRYKPGNLIIRVPLVLTGVNQPVLDGEGRFEVITVQTPGVTIRGFRIVHTGVSSIEDFAAIKVIAGHHVTIDNNLIEEAFFGIHLSNTDSARISNNIISHTEQPEESRVGNGIHLWKCQGAVITRNQITGHRDGIYFEFVTGSRVESNFSHHNLRYGLHFMFSHQDTYLNNRFESNGAGVAVMYTHHVTMIGNSFIRNWGPSAYGLLLKEIRDSEVSQNIFESNTMAIYMEGSSRITLSGNEFRTNGYAVRLQASCDDNHFARNNFKGNTFDLATNGSLVMNKLDHNYWDRYEGYDLNHDGIGDIAYHPANLFTLISERIPAAMVLWRSFTVYLMDRAEKAIPSLIPAGLQDTAPMMKSYDRLASTR